jgi:hemerythrin-like domain-containing protein
MKLTERLKVEHGVYLLQLRHVEALVNAGAPAAELSAVVRAIVVAEEHHAKLEDTVLYPALARALGREFEPLVQIGRDHEQLAVLGHEAMSTGTVTDVQAFVGLMRAHLEREIHDIFPVADELLPSLVLNAMGNWEEDHVYEEMGHPAPWERTRRA